MNKELFIELINKIMNLNDYFDKLSDLHIDLFESPIRDYCDYSFDQILKAYFTNDGLDMIYWWLYEKNGNPEIKAFDKYHIEIPTKTIDDLWDIVKDYLK